MPDENGHGNINNAQLKMDSFLVTIIRLTVTLVSKCDVAMVWAVWLLIRHVRHHSKIIIYTTLLLIPQAFMLLMTKHIHVYLSVITSWNCNLWASNWPEISFLVFKMWNFLLKRDGQSVTFSVEFNNAGVLNVHSKIYYLPNCPDHGNITLRYQHDC